MRRIQISYELSEQVSPENLARNPLMDLLYAVRTQGSISAAARALGYSYRHVWGELKRWETVMGQELIVWGRGQAATLTPFGEKLLWTERLAQARLAPQIETLRTELERTLALAFDPSSHVLSLYASHDDALPLLQEHAQRSERLHLDIHFCGSVDAIRALNEGRCVVAGFHTREAPPAGSPAELAYRPLLQPGRHKLIGFAQRTVGLIVAPGNPRQLKSLADVAKWRLRFVNRPQGTGTRLHLEELLQASGLSPADLPGYGHCEPSHAAVAQVIQGGGADAGLGTESAAHRLGLGFVPLLRENYHLACLKSALDHPPLQALRQCLASPGWPSRLAEVPGYTPLNSGQVESLRTQLPWWNFPARQKKA